MLLPIGNFPELPRRGTQGAGATLRPVPLSSRMSFLSNLLSKDFTAKSLFLFIERVFLSLQIYLLGYYSNDLRAIPPKKYSSENLNWKADGNSFKYFRG